MTNEQDPTEQSVPELSDKIERSLQAPDPSAIHAGLHERQGFRRQILTGAAGVFAVVAILGGIFAFTTNDETTATETASADGADERLSSSSGDAVADHSAPTEFTEAAAVVSIDECANGSTLSANGALWRPTELPPEWEGQGTMPVTVVVSGAVLIATDVQGLSAPFTLDQDGYLLDCLGFTLQQETTDATRLPAEAVPVPTTAPTTTAPTTTTAAPTTTTSTTVAEPPPSTPGPDAVLVTTGDIDGVPGDEQIWLEPDGTLRAGDLSGIADYWPVSEYWFGEQTELSTVPFDGDTTAIVLALPLEGEEEDPANVYQIFIPENGALKLIFNQMIGERYQSHLEFPGNGTATYLEDGWSACSGVPRSEDAEGIRQRVELSIVGGFLVETSREDTTEIQDCNLLAG